MCQTETGVSWSVRPPLTHTVGHLRGFYERLPRLRRNNASTPKNARQLITTNSTAMGHLLVQRKRLCPHALNSERYYSPDPLPNDFASGTNSSLIALRLRLLVVFAQPYRRGFSSQSAGAQRAEYVNIVGVTAGADVPAIRRCTHPLPCAVPVGRDSRRADLTASAAQR